MRLERAIIEYVLTQETIFIGLFLFLFYQQNTELKCNREFIKEQQKILDKLTDKVEGIDLKIDRVIEKAKAREKK